MDYTALANEVLAAYDISNPRVDFIRHNENITFKITYRSAGKHFLLRIHKPVSEGLFGIQHTFEGLESEMKILEQLNCNSPLKAQKPVANTSGNYVTDTSLLMGCSCYSTLLEWIDGETLTGEEENINDIAFKLGENLAYFHQCLHEFKPQKELIRPVYDKNRIDFAIEELKYCINIGLFSKENYQIIKEVFNIVKEQADLLDSRGNTWGIVHADMQPGNIVVSNGNPCIIDFGFCGFGYYMFDLGSAATVLDSGLRKTFLEGYASKTAFSFGDVRLIEGQIFMDTFISYVLFMKDNNSWIKTSAEKLCNTLCKEFIAGREVFYSF